MATVFNFNAAFNARKNRTVVPFSNGSEVVRFPEPELNEMGLSQLLESVVDLVAGDGEHDIQLDAPELPAVCGSCAALTRLFVNLLKLAVADGGGRVHVAAWQASMGTVMVRVGGATLEDLGQREERVQLSGLVCRSLAEQVCGDVYTRTDEDGVATFVELSVARLAA